MSSMCVPPFFFFSFAFRRTPNPFVRFMRRGQTQLKLEGLPASVTDDMLKEDEEFLRTFHHILLEVSEE